MDIMWISWVNLINKQVLSIIMIKSDSAKPWIITYIPKNLAEVVGQDEATSQIREFVEDFKTSTWLWGVDCEIRQQSIWQGDY